MASPLDFAYYTFQPRPDQPHRYDQQSAFLYSQHPGVTFLLGGNGAGTSTLALRKAVDFMLQTPPPRRDTPFWIIAESYEQTMNVCWKEKLHQLGHLPPQEVEWERIRWYKPNNDWPYAVPLKPWPGRPGKNWQIVFKSYDQGRAKMQGESIGGFLFVEQFPWGLLEEVLRGCREYSFCGNKLAEFTPVNPALSIELQEMEESNKLPPGWAIYRSNTECAVEAGHVSQQWFEQFFGMVPEAMRGVRTKGLWGGFEGAIYPEFDRAIHCLPSGWDIPPACHHRRMIDWGFGVDNAFCCLFACRNGVGQWFIYDEYYSTASCSVIEHLKAISDRHPWPRSSPYYGVTWADPSNLNCHRIASKFADYAPGYESINCQAGNNSVDEGIEHVKWLLKCDPALAMEDGRPQPRLFIDRNRCPNLVRQMTTYRRIRSAKTGLNPRDAIDAPLKADDHACFPAGTLVDTPLGKRPIESLRIGDRVFSHRGIAVVEQAGFTGFRETVEVELEDGRVIEVTPDHPFGVDADKWIRADQTLNLCLNSRCEPGQPVTGIRSKLFNMAGTNGAGTQLTKGTRRGITFAGVNGEAVKPLNCGTSGCISRSTSTPTDQSLMDVSSIIATKMHGLRPESTTSNVPAWFAAARSLQTAMTRRRSARRNVRLVESVRVSRLAGKKGVFNLSTSDGTFFVNGVLVSNCDALRYGVFSEASISGISPSTIARQHEPQKHGVQVNSSRFSRYRRKR